MNPDYLQLTDAMVQLMESIDHHDRWDAILRREPVSPETIVARRLRLRELVSELT